MDKRFIGESAHHLVRFIYRDLKKLFPESDWFQHRRKCLPCIRGVLNNIFINALEGDMRAIQDAHWGKNTIPLDGKIRTLKCSNKPEGWVEIKKAILNREIKTYVWKHLGLNSTSLTYKKSCDLTAQNLLPHLENADNNYHVELGEVHSIKGHPKRCSVQILSSTVAGTSCSHDTNTKRNHAEKALGVLTDYRFNINSLMRLTIILVSCK